MIKRPHLLYYSTSTYIALHINSLFYGQHYLWCSPVFDPASLDRFNPLGKIPASSSPSNIYKSYLRDVATGDRHSALIAQNREGIKRGALYKLQQGIIDKNEYNIIHAMVDQANIVDFRPVLYLIPSTVVIAKMKRVPVEEVANPLGVEYRVEDLLDW